MLHPSTSAIAALFCGFVFGCSGTEDPAPRPNGGAGGIGSAGIGGGGFGGAGIGGAGAGLASGGMTSSGGSAVSGASSMTGGSSARGGAPAGGGQSASGGAQSATGGAIARGGTTSAGGMKATGGTAMTGGGSAGASPGCASTNTTSTCSKSGTPCSLDVSGTARTYYVQLPSNYSPSRPYPVVFQFHPRGGSAEQAMTMYRISTGMPDAIYVSPQGLSSSGTTGWPNTNGQDIAFTRAMIADLQAKFCVDNARIFSTGFSYGGMMSFAIGCQMGDVFRAIAPMAGALYSDFNCRGTGPAIAMWGAHGLSDSVVPIADGRAARDRILQQNHCGTETVPIDPSPCVSYQGCDSGRSVTWCEWNGDHAMPSFGSSAIAAFFRQF